MGRARRELWSPRRLCDLRSFSIRVDVDHHVQADQRSAGSEPQSVCVSSAAHPRAFEDSLFDTLFGRWVANTLFVGISVVIITLLLAIPAGYSLARLSGKFGEKLGIAIFLTYLVPSTILFIPLSRVVAILHLQDSLLSLVLVYPSFTVPFCTWLLMGFFKVIPKDLEEAAMIDGLSRFGAFLRVIMPMSVAGGLTVVHFSFTLGPQAFLYGLTLVS